MKEASRVVVWSGGADSTVVLHELAKNSSKLWPVTCLTIESEFLLNAQQQKNQKAARQRYLALAAKSGFHIESTVIRVDAGELQATDQASLWLAHLSPYLSDKISLYFGYVLGDSYWQRKTEFEEAWRALQALEQKEWQIHYPLKHKSKSDVLSSLERNRIPANCWWTCEKPPGKKPCGHCNKCIELAVGIYERGLREKGRTLSMKAKEMK